MASRVKRQSQTFSPISNVLATDDKSTTSSSVQDAEFQEKKWVWIPDDNIAFIKGFVVSEETNGMFRVRCSDDSDRVVSAEIADKVNPPQFDKADDMAELTYLNEASVVHNLSTRYAAKNIYTYSGLFLVAVNPYASLPIYDSDTIAAYKNKQRDETKPHIFAVADLAFRNMLELNENQSILVTGESGAGKTENTKKVIQYLAAITSESHLSQQARKSKPNSPTFEQQILQANPILEAFGNAQTVRNNNSSRFGKFIRIEFSKSGQIAGASIDWYLLEKSRVIYQNTKERNYHIFYQLLSGASRDHLEGLMLEPEANSYNYLKNSNKLIEDVNDKEEFHKLISALKIMGISSVEQNEVFRLVSAILHIGNIELGAENTDQGRILNYPQVEKVCHLLGINPDQFSKGLLRPRVKAGREWVTQSRSASQVRNALDALSKSLYERIFAYIVNRINDTLERTNDNTTFIGVLDIAGFEIFEKNSFEQLCINYTNEKLQQFFNHHMFVLEQEEYTRENIEWKFIDFGRDLQPTIDLIEKPNPMGIFSCLDEECVMPKATDKTFTDKLNQLWSSKSEKFRPSRLTQGFTLTHYAADVEYRTEGWLEKNKDPLNDNVTQLLVDSSERIVRVLFEEEAKAQHAVSAAMGGASRVKKGIFRTVAQRHKEQLTHLMTQLHSTHPHFVRCIIPNHEKKPGKFDNMLVLDQLRCNGVLEGIRIARTGYPNRLFFSEFRQRYEVLAKNMPKGYVEGQKASSIILKDMGLDENLYKIGLTKVFFKAGVLAELEERRESMIRQLICRFQSVARGHLVRRQVEKELFKSRATQLIKKNFETYLQLKPNPWWKLYVRMRPLLLAAKANGSNRIRDQQFKKLEESVKQYESQRAKLEEDQRRAELELERVNKVLEGERLIALDKEEILKRAKARENELEEQLTTALEELESLESQCEQLLESKKRVDAQADLWKKELENGGHIISLLENEKKELIDKIADTEEELKNILEAQETKNGESQKLSEELKFLNSLLADKDKKIKELEEKLKVSDQELEGKVKSLTSNYESASKQVKDLLKENKDIRSQLDDLFNTSSGYEELLRKKESELATHKSDISRLKEDLEQINKVKYSLQQKHDTMEKELKVARRDMKELQESYSRLEKEAEYSRKLLEAKISQNEKESQGRKLLDNQIQDLKLDLSKQAQAFAAEKQKFQGEIDAKQAKINKLASEKELLKTENAELQSAADEKASLLRELKVEKERSANVERLRKELSSLKQKLEVTEKSKQDTDASMVDLEGKLRDASRKSNSLDNMLQAAEKEKERLSKTVSENKSKIEELTQQKESLMIEKSRLSKELEDSRLIASNEAFEKKKAREELSKKNDQIEKLRSSITEEINSRVKKLTVEKQALETSEKRLQKAHEELNVQHDTLKMQREKLVREVEDLNHDISREQKTALAAERLKNQIQEKYDKLKEANENQRRDRSEGDVARRKLISALETAKNELKERTDQLMVLQKILHPKSKSPLDLSKTSPEIDNLVDLGKRVQDAEKARKDAEESKALLEAQLKEMKERWDKEQDERESKYFASRRAILDDLTSSPTQKSSKGFVPGHKRPMSTSFANISVFGGNESNSRGTFGANSRMGPPKSSPISLNNSSFGASLGRRSIASDESVGDKENVDSSLPNFSGKSVEEVEDMFASLQNSKNDLLAVYHDTSKNLVKVKESLADTQQEKNRLEKELYSLQMSTPGLPNGGLDQSQMADLQVQLESEIARNEDLLSSMRLYKGRAEEYYSRLESAETVVLKASRAEQFAKSQLKEAEDALIQVQSDYRQAEKTIMELQSKLHKLEGEFEDNTIDLSHTRQTHERVAKELEQLKDRYNRDVKEASSSLDAMRSRYSEEIRLLSNELEAERQKRADAQHQIKTLEYRMDRMKNSNDPPAEGSWVGIKNQLEAQVEELSRQNEESTLAYRDSQKRIGSLLSQVRTLRTTMDEITVDRDQLQKDKRTLEQRLSEVSERFEELAQGTELPRSRGASVSDKEIQELRAALKRQTEMSHAAEEKLKKTRETLEQDHLAIQQERKMNEELRTEHAELEKEKNALNLKIIDLEARLLRPKTDETKYLQEKVRTLEAQLNEQIHKYAEETRQLRSNDRSVKDLYNQLSQKDKHISRLQDDAARSDSRVQRLTESLEAIQSSETAHRQAARRAEREARDAKERALRLEKELEDWKSRFEYSTNRQPSFV
ncbi:myosin-1 [Trichomonascus vanleenenianus]|uniref:myosin 1 n=1 Tax=Trichomonascus vanleenenianus TaxID=2268995 RepID=UPI003ECB121C